MRLPRLLVSIIALGQLSPVVALAADELKRAPVQLSVGANVWYNRWQPAFMDGKVIHVNFNTSATPLRPSIIDGDDFKGRNLPLYGPLLSVKLFNRVSVSSVFMYGHTVYRVRGLARQYSIPLMITPNGAIQYTQRDYRRSVSKMDVDSSLSYHLTPYLSLFAGYKYQSYRYDERMLSYAIGPGIVIREKRRKNNHSHGAGLGISANVQLYRTIYFQASASGIIMRGRDSIDASFAFDTSGGAGRNSAKKGSYLAYGGTGSAAVVYTMPVDVSFSLGFRCQVLRYRQRFYEYAYERINGRYDFFYGLTGSVIYHVRFGGAR